MSFDCTVLTMFPEAFPGPLGVSLIASLIVGYALSGLGRRGLIQGGLFAAAVSLTTFAILEIDNPRGAFVQLDAAEQMLKALQDTMRTD